MSGHSEAQLSLGLNSNGAFKYALFDEYIVTVRQTTRAWVYPAAAVRICAMHPLKRGETAKPAKTKEPWSAFPAVRQCSIHAADEEAERET